ncbi:hypothetical protein AB0A81_22860 [Streptomyces flaveolus]|uniref:Uncharacterized protein n=1 Tax=Streptomyces flaveolus TaxID=67297 RepID=A0ABV1VCZ4_9ACTN
MSDVTTTDLHEVTMALSYLHEDTPAWQPTWPDCPPDALRIRSPQPCHAVVSEPLSGLTTRIRRRLGEPDDDAPARAVPR